MFVNKAHEARTIAVRFGSGSTSFAGTLTEVTYGSAQYAWHATGASSYAKPNDPPAVTPIAASPSYVIPAQSITVLRGSVLP
jgi:hypothetical protein